MYYTYIIEMNSRIQHVTNVYSVTLKNSNSRFNPAENEFVGRGGGGGGNFWHNSTNICGTWLTNPCPQF